MIEAPAKPSVRASHSTEEDLRRIRHLLKNDDVDDVLLHTESAIEQRLIELRLVQQILKQLSVTHHLANGLRQVHEIR